MLIDVIEKTFKNLEKNGFNAEYFVSSKEALEWLLDQIPQGKTAASGGSVTLSEMGLIEKLEAKGVEYLSRYNPPPGKTKKDMERMAFCADFYFSSANAITEDGYILNVDANGNRVAALSYGPDKVFIVCGHNKICKDIDAAYRRNEEVAAPLNCRRLKKETPCNSSGACADCESEDRICCIYTLMKRAPFSHDITVVLIGEDLGY